MTLRVECRAHDGSPEVPARIGAADRELLDVTEIEDSWPGEGYCYFRLRTGDGARWILRHDERHDTWSLHYFEAAPGGAGPGATPPGSAG